jgi:hypothetical protein
VAVTASFAIEGCGCFGDFGRVACAKPAVGFSFSLKITLPAVWCSVNPLISPSSMSFTSVTL